MSSFGQSYKRVKVLLTPFPILYNKFLLKINHEFLIMLKLKNFLFYLNKLNKSCAVTNISNMKDV